jgi:uncharacterized membrane protein YbhN (UPF0104 family)
MAIFCVLLVASIMGAHALSRPSASSVWNWLGARLRLLPVAHGQAALESWAALWSPARMLGFSLTALMAYGIQAGVFAWLCSRMGVRIELADAVVVFVNATLFGAATMIPSGLGAMETALSYQLMSFGSAESTAVSLAIMTRLVTLWMGIGLGCLSLVSFMVKKEDKPSDRIF